MASDTYFLMEYVVKDSDTIERIAATHDCTVGELMKMNRLSSRIVFGGQKLVVPSALSDDDQAAAIAHSTQQTHETNEIRRGPGLAVPIHRRTLTVGDPSSGIMLAKEKVVAPSTAETTQDIMRRFIKVKVKQLTEEDGIVTGTLLITPNAFMFDPDVMHPLVIEKGQNPYIMMAQLDEVVSVAMYKDVGALIGDENMSKVMYDPNHVTEKIDGEPVSQTGEVSTVEGTRLKTEPIQAEEVHSLPVLTSIHDDKVNDTKDERLKYEQLYLFLSTSQLPEISESQKSSDRSERLDPYGSRRAFSDVGGDLEDSEKGKLSKEIKSSFGRPRNYSEEPSTSAGIVNSTNRISAGDHSPFSKFGKTLSTRANSLRGSVTSSAGKMTHTAISGTKSVAHGVVAHGKFAAGTLQTGIQSGAKMAASHAKGIATISTGIFSSPASFDTGTPSGNEKQTSASLLRKQNLAILETLKQKTQMALDEAVRNSNFSRATTMEEMPNLLKSINELLMHSPDGDQNVLTEPPYYMTIQVKHTKHLHRGRSHTMDTSILSRSPPNNGVKKPRRQEFWYAIPRQRVNSIYLFLLQCNAEKYGEKIAEGYFAESTTSEKAVREALQDNGFIVLDSNADENLTGEKPSGSLFGSNYLNREWEIVSVQEMSRRLSLDQLDKVVLPLPDGAASSEILDESMARQLVDALPARATGYPWTNIYNSEKHGFSLHTFYRKMIEWNEEMSPILLIIRDCTGNVFGAIVSTAILPSEHFFGTGDSCLLYRFVTDPESGEKDLQTYSWSGENQFFVKASTDSLSVGAGGGHYGLWLDADLNHGRSQKCETFQNDPLCGADEDFTVQFLEAFGFRMT